jgi:hypothetical protein
MAVLSFLLGVSPACGGEVASSEKGSGVTAQCPEAANWIEAMERKHPGSHTISDNRPSNPALRRELARRAATDQKARERAMEAGGTFDKANIKAMLAVDANNLAWLKPIIQARGFPTKAEVGKKGVNDAWLLVQHADTDPSFQAHVLKQLKARVGKGGISKSKYALLTDRVRLAQGKKQMYGSQISMKHGVYALRPTEDVAGLAKRRAAMDLMPMADYMCVIKATYGSAAKFK